jgi:hypothetical protein
VNAAKAPTEFLRKDLLEEWISFFPMVLFKVNVNVVFDDTQNTNYIFGFLMEILWKLVINER